MNRSGGRERAGSDAAPARRGGTVAVLGVLALAAALLAAACVGWSGAPGAEPDGATPAGPTGATPAIPGAPERPTGRTEEATLVEVVDGDTIRVLVGGVEEPVRYIGMDTPEPHPRSAATPEPYADAATAANRRLLGAGDRLVLERDVSDRDQYGRLLRHVWVDGERGWILVGLALVADGFARVSTYPPDVRYVDALVAAERSARLAGRGLWSPAP